MSYVFTVPFRDNVKLKRVVETVRLDKFIGELCRHAVYPSFAPVQP